MRKPSKMVERESWAIVVEVTALSADERADFNSAIRAEVTA